MTGGERELPEGWAWSTFRGVATVAANLTDPSDFPDRPHIAPNHIESGTTRLLDYTTVLEDGVTSPKHRFFPGQILYSKIRPYLAKVTLVDFEGLCSADMYPIATPLNSSYLLHWMVSPMFTEIASRSQGRSVLPKINQRDLASLPVPVPPLVEQERIVAAIEEHLSRLEVAEAALHAIERKLDLMVRVVLASACSGDWPKRPLGEITTSLRNGVFVSRPAAEPPGMPIYRISAVRPLNLRTDDVRYASPEPPNAKSYAVEAGDLLFTRYSGNPDYVGAAAVVPPAGAGILHPDKLIRVVADRAQAVPEWIAAYVTAGEGRREIERRLKTTAGQVGIAGGQLKTVPVAVPPVQHQTEMVEMIASVRSQQDRLAKQARAAADHSAALRRSILAAAFSGRLVPQDPADESANALLARIATDRPAATSGQKRVRA